MPDHASAGAAEFKPFAGLRVIELARILAGPWAGQVFADLGAEVIKVEHPEGGDDTRRWGPPFVTRTDKKTPDAAYFHSCNRGKKSVCIDFRTEQGQAQIRDLCCDADILIENFKVGTLEKYGLDYQNLKKINPKLIYCAITGFGQTGPYANLSGYDFLVQGIGGLMSVTGEAAGDPQKTGVAYADIFTGLYSVIAIQASLWHRQQTGEGAYLDLALLDSQAGVLANQALNYFVSGTAPQRMGNAHPNIVPYQVFECRDGHVIIAVGNDAQFKNLCRFLDRADLQEDVRFGTNQQRVVHRNILIPLLQACFSKKSQHDILQGLHEYHVPGGPINDIAAVFEDTQIQHRQLQICLESYRFIEGGIQTVAQPFLINGQRPLADTVSPDLGEHTLEYLSAKKEPVKN